MAGTALILLPSAATCKSESQGIHVNPQGDFKPQGESSSLGGQSRSIPPHPTGRLDWFLSGLESYQQERFTEAIDACDHILQTRTDDFWAHYVKALAQLRLSQWPEARAELTVCLNLKPVFVWPRLLRGVATKISPANSLPLPCAIRPHQAMAN